MRNVLLCVLRLFEAVLCFGMTRVITHVLWVAMTILGAAVIHAADYPSKPIRMVTSEISGGTDKVARLIVQALTANLGWSVIVDNRPTVISIDTASKAPPDGYTLLVSGTTLWLAPLLQKTAYDPVRDFSPITLTDRSPSILVVNPSVPVKSVQELIALAKAKPGALNYSSSTAGTSSQLSTELFNSMAGIKLVRVAYRGGGPGILAVIAGETQVMIPLASAVVQHVKSGTLRGLAVTSGQPSQLAPGLPTVAASGLPGYESVNFQAVFVPAKTPSVIVRRLNQEILRVLDQGDMKERFLQIGTESFTSSPEQAAGAIKTDVTRWSKVIKDADIHAE